MDVIGFFGLDRDGNGLVCFVDVWGVEKGVGIATAMFNLFGSDCAMN